MTIQDEIVAAAQSGDTAKLRDLLARDASLAAARDAQGVSAIMHALYRRQNEALRLLLEKNPPLDIFEAASTGHADRLNELLAQDPSLVHQFSPDGFTALHFACYFSSDQTARLLIEKGAEVSAVSRNPMRLMPLHSAASARNAGAVQALLEHGAGANARQEKGWTPLHAAAQNKDEATADILLRHGADPNLANDDGVTPLDLARKSGMTLSR
ncbi:MAG TPA: ankyrin repeat domain-containing protein [Terriglobales bacterium]|nr:ankyrin repeat domain-containing protein [Terriglobales bacterium]